MQEKEKIILEGNSFYSVDLECTRRKEKKKKASSDKKPVKREERGR